MSMVSECLTLPAMTELHLQPSRAMKIQGEGVTAERSVLSVHEHLTEHLQHSSFERTHTLSTVASDGRARQTRARQRSLRGVNEHGERAFNTARPSAAG